MDFSLYYHALLKAIHRCVHYRHSSERCIGLECTLTVTVEHVGRGFQTGYGQLSGVRLDEVAAVAARYSHTPVGDGRTGRLLHNQRKLITGEHASTSQQGWTETQNVTLRRTRKCMHKKCSCHSCGTRNNHRRTWERFKS